MPFLHCRQPKMTWIFFVSHPERRVYRGWHWQDDHGSAASSRVLIMDLTIKWQSNASNPPVISHLPPSPIRQPSNHLPDPLEEHPTRALILESEIPIEASDLGTLEDLGRDLLDGEHFHRVFEIR